MLLIRLKDFVAQDLSLKTTAAKSAEVLFKSPDFLVPGIDPFGDGSSFLAIHDPEGFDQFLESYRGTKYTETMLNWYSRWAAEGNDNISHIAVSYDYRYECVNFGLHFKKGSPMMGGHHRSSDGSWSSHT